MIIDKLLEFSTAQTLTASAASEDYVDTLAAGSAYGNELWLVVRVGTALASAGGAAKLTIGLQSDSASDFTTSSTLITHVSSGEIAEASCTANTIIWKTKIPTGLQRYLRLYYTVGTENFTSGTIDAFLTPDVPIGF
jgi:hypothetical protein